MPKSLKQSDRIEKALQLLGLEGIRFSYSNLAQKFIKDKSNPYDFLECLLEKQIVWKEENRLQRWLQQAHFPWQKTLKDFDFSFQPSIDKRQVYELASCRFIDKGENVIFLGPPGVGKTHLAISLGLEAIYKGYEVRFLTLDQLIELANRASDGEKLRRLFSTLVRQRLLILDEMDLYEADSAVSTFLFKLLHQRYEEGSVIFTSNKTFTDWGKLFGSQARAGAILDRITHHSTIITIEGESYRIKDKLKG